jgi:TonB family protein
MSEPMDRVSIGRGRLNGMILISLLLHGVVLSLLFFTPSFPSPKLTFGPVYTVSLVDFSESSLSPGGDAETVNKLLGVAGPVTAFKKHPVPEPLNLSRSLEGHDRQNETIEKAMEEIRKRAASMPRSTRPEKSGSISQLSPSAISARIKAYTDMVASRIKGKWTYPILPGEQLETRVDMKILHSGMVAEMNIEIKSGNRHFDESVLKAIQKASPFPPLPEWFSENNLDVVIRFNSSELKSRPFP